MMVFYYTSHSTNFLEIFGGNEASRTVNLQVCPWNSKMTSRKRKKSFITFISLINVARVVNNCRVLEKISKPDKRRVGTNEGPGIFVTLL